MVEKHQQYKKGLGKVLRLVLIWKVLKKSQAASRGKASGCFPSLAEHFCRSQAWGGGAGGRGGAAPPQAEEVGE